MKLLQNPALNIPGHSMHLLVEFFELTEFLERKSTT